MVDLEQLIEDRIEAIISRDASLDAVYEIMEEENANWGVIAVLDRLNEVQRLEFIESEISWMRPEAIDEYNEAADNEIPVSVIVPNEAFLAMSSRVQKYGSRDIAVFGYDAILLRVKALPI